MKSWTTPDRPGARARRLARPIFTSAVLVIGLVLTSASSWGKDIIDRVLAVVSGEIVTQSDVQGALALGLIDGADAADPLAAGLHELIDRTLILAEVRRFAPAEPRATEIDDRIDQMRRRFGSAAALTEVLAASGIDAERLRLLARDDLRMKAYLAERFAGSPQPTDQQIDDYLRAQQKTPVRDGRTPSLEEARDLARQQLADQRRQASIADWIGDLRRRADITELYPSRR
jgi:hypothetical protein